MTQTSSWPLTSSSVRYVIPPFALEGLATDVRSRDLYPEAVGHYVSAAGHVMQRSAAEHEDHLLMHCIQGGGWLQVDGERRPVRAGDVMVLPAGVGHAYEADVDTPWTLYWCHVGGANVQVFLAALLGGERYTVNHPGLAAGLLTDWQALLDTRSPGYEPERLQLMAARVRMLMLVLAQSGQQAGGIRSRLDVAMVQAWMQAHLDQAVSLERLADVAGMEKFHFARTFRRLTGQAPLAHFQHRRMARACEWLDTGEDGIGEIAQRLGYTDPHYFSRQFRQVIGMAPSAYRALKRG
jgi:AraC-like DNA-binding protein